MTKNKTQLKTYEVVLSDENGNEQVIKLRAFDRLTYSMVFKFISTDPLKAMEVVVDNLVIEGDKDEIKEDIGNLIALVEPVTEMLNTKTAVLKKK